MMRRLLLLVFACGCASRRDSATSDPSTLPDGVTLGAVQACDAPVDVAWQEVDWGAAAYPAPTNTDELPVEPGGVALIDAGDRRLVYWIPADDTEAHGLDLDTFAPLAPVGRVAGALAQGDVDGDGLVDLVVVGGQSAVVWSVGTDDEASADVPVRLGARDVALADFDGDGDTDLLFSYTDAEARPDALRYQFARNDGGRAFAVSSVDGPPDDFWGPDFDVTAVDLDGDGALDAYTCNDLGGKGYQNGALAWRGGGFEVADARGADVSMSCMGTAIGDVDGDGTLDLFLSDAFRPYLMRDVDGFVESGSSYGLSAYREEQMSWGAAIDDLDDDGLPDLLLATSDFLTADYLPFPTEYYRQTEPGKLVKAPAPFLAQGVGRGVVARDWNGDGVLDVLLGDGLREPHLFASTGCSEGAWLEVAAPPGTVVRVEAGDRVWGALVTTEAGFASSGPPVAHVGLGDVAAVDAVELRPPGGDVVRVEGPFGTRRTLTWQP